MTDFKFQPGDRVAERPRVKLNIASTAESRAVFNRHSKQRYGTVTATTIRVHSRGPRRKVILVQWDGSQQPSEHEQMRLCAIDDLPELTQSTLNSHAA